MFLRIVVASAALIFAGCGPSGPAGPTPSPSPSGPKPGGAVSGHYVLQVQPGAGCVMPRGSLSFPMVAAQAGALPHPGVQVVVEGSPASLELELEQADFTLRGGFGTTGAGVLSSEGVRLWISSIGAGPVTQASDGRGEIVTGSLGGYLALGREPDEEGSLGTCTALDHTFSLRAR